MGKKKKDTTNETLPTTDFTPKDTTEFAVDTTDKAVQSTGLELVEDDDKDGERSDKKSAQGNN